MWSITQTFFTGLVRRQIRLNAWSSLQSMALKTPITRSSKDEKHENLDLIIGEEHLTEQELTSADQQEMKAAKLAKIFKITTSKMQEILRAYPRVSRKSMRRLEWSAKLLKTKFPVNKILEYPSILNLSWRLMDHRIRIYEEIGATKLNNVPGLLLFDAVCSMTLFELQTRRVISSRRLLNNILSKIEKCPPNLYAKLNDIFSPPAVSCFPLKEYRAIIIRQYLIEVFGEFELPTQTMELLTAQSVEMISMRINLLLYELKLKPSFILSQPPLLLVNTQNLLRIIQEMNEMNGDSLAELALKNPKVLALEASWLSDANEKLSDLKLSPELTEELKKTCNIDDGAKLPPNLNGDTQKLSKTYEVFRRVALAEAMTREKTVGGGRAMLVKGWTNPNRTTAEVLAKRLGATKTEKVRLKALLDHHPLRKITGFSTCMASCNYLLEQNILNEAQIIHDAEVLAWNPQKLQKVWESFPVKEYEAVLGPEWRSHPQLAEMIVYELNAAGVNPFSETEGSDVEEGDSLSDVDEDNLSEDESTENELWLRAKALEHSEAPNLVRLEEDDYEANAEFDEGNEVKNENPLCSTERVDRDEDYLGQAIAENSESAKNNGK